MEARARSQDALAEPADCSTASSWARTRLVAKAKETGKFDYDAPMEGLQALDRYTIRIKLNYPSYDLLAEPDAVRTAARWRAK